MAIGKLSAQTGGGNAHGRPRCQGRMFFAFIEAKRESLDRRRGRLGAGFSQEGQTGERTVPLGSELKGVKICNLVERDLGCFAGVSLQR